ncbi:N-acetylmuramoyl-L-alanine amidase [Streptomyces sp. NPDC048604]|uniref:N-acetylmuramoyl-L-alanine amidase n=1 Tax=Streptomyces sp. NPDC048604 TaxID=3365578 RepID=UPI003718B72B
MAWYPGAVKMELQPESDSQPAIRPTQFIVHSIIAPWTAKRTYEYWRDSTNLESHFGLGYEGDLGQFIGTETRADANYQANRRPDGTGAVSIETASNTKGTDPWTPAQIEQLIRLGVWLHETHDIPLRICRTWDDPGFGYHRLHDEWAKDGTNCPGDARVRQFRELVFPGIVARASGQTPAPAPSEEDDPMPKVITESSDTDSGLKAKTWTTVAMATDTALLQGPVAYSVAAYLRIGGTPGTQVKGRFYDQYPDGHGSQDLAIDLGTVGPDGVLDAQIARPGQLADRVQLKLEVWADKPATITYRVLRSLRWTA